MQSNPFLTRLSQCANGPWYLGASQSEPDEQVLQLAWEDPQRPWCDTSSFLDFLEANYRRRLLRCFVGRTPHEKYRSWTIEQLMQETRPPSRNALEEAIVFCQMQHFALSHPTRKDMEHLLTWLQDEGELLDASPEEIERWLAKYPEESNTWSTHPRIEGVFNIGPTLEWAVQALLQREYHALARRHVQLSRVAPFGDIDVLAFLGDGRILTVECKSSSKRITDGHLERFVRRAKIFPADISLLLIDSDDPHQMLQRLGQLRRSMLMEYGEYRLTDTFLLEECCVVHLRDNLYAANTGGGLLATLKAVLEVSS
jgi:hypothetical protein